MTTPILTDALIECVLQEQRRKLRPPNGLGHAAWPFRTEAALASLTSDGWCHLGWIERVSQTTARTMRYQVWWQVDRGEVRLEQEITPIIVTEGLHFVPASGNLICFAGRDRLTNGAVRQQGH